MMENELQEMVDLASSSLAKLTDFMNEIEGHVSHQFEEMEVRVVSNDGDTDPEVVEHYIQDGVLEVAVDLSNVIEVFLRDELDFRIIGSDGYELDAYNVSVNIDKQVIIHLDTKKMIDDKLKEFVEAQIKVEKEKEMTGVEMLGKLGFRDLEHLKNRLEKLAKLEAIIST